MWYTADMKRIHLVKNKQLPVFVEKDEDGVYVAECPLFKGCYSQGKTVDEAMKNIKEVVELCLEEKENKETIKFYSPREISLHTITV
jgi:predicted RNase H-like HicB family nuclease